MRRIAWNSAAGFAFSVSICTPVLVKQINLHCCTSKASKFVVYECGASPEIQQRSAFSVSICTFVLVKKVNAYFCTSKVSKRMRPIAWNSAAGFRCSFFFSREREGRKDHLKFSSRVPPGVHNKHSRGNCQIQRDAPCLEWNKEHPCRSIRSESRDVFIARLYIICNMPVYIHIISRASKDMRPCVCVCVCVCIYI